MYPSLFILRGSLHSPFLWVTVHGSLSYCIISFLKIFSLRQSKTFISTKLTECVWMTQSQWLPRRKWAYETRIGLSTLMKAFITFIVDQLVFGLLKSVMKRWQHNMCHVWWRKEILTKFWSENPEGKVQSFEKSKCRWNNNIETDLTEIWWKDRDRFNLLQVRGIGGVLWRQ